MTPHPSPYDGQTDEQLMDLARRTMIAAAKEAPGTIERAMKFAAHESVLRELSRRLLRHSLNALNEKLGLPPLD